MRHYKSLIHSTNYANDAKYNCYQIKPEGNLSRPWELHGYRDTDYAGDNDTQKRMTGYTVLINEFIITWHL